MPSAEQPVSVRRPLLASRGVVATTHPLAAQAGLDVLRRGGNAVDAAVATAVSLAVVEPTSNGIGSDAFAIVHDGSALHGVNGSGRSPGRLDVEALHARGATMPERGWGTVTVPGAPRLWGDLLERFGRMSFAEVAASAIEQAEEGVPVPPVVARNWARAVASLGGHREPCYAGFHSTFTRDGEAPVTGSLWRSPDHATTLRTLAEDGVDAFYTGAIAERIAAFAAATGGALDGDDLAAHASEWVTPISASYAGHEIWQMPPNGQGIAALQAMAMLEGGPVHALAHLGEERLHWQIEAMKLAFADAWRYVADPAVVDVPTAGLLDPAYIAARAALIGPKARMPEPGRPPKGGTVYLATADRDGMMVSFIQSGYDDFGSGIVVPGTGISLQNRGSCFSLERNHPNEAAPAKRPRHTILPAFLTRAGRAIGPFGVMGGEMQPQGHLQVIGHLLDHGLDPQAALDAPRWRVTGGLGVSVESGFDADVLDALATRGHALTRDCPFDDFGRGQVIVRHESGVYEAGSEPRADGAAVGY